MTYYIFIQPIRNPDTGALYGNPGVDRVPADQLPEGKAPVWLQFNMIIEAAVDDPLIPRPEPVVDEPAPEQAPEPAPQEQTTP